MQPALLLPGVPAPTGRQRKEAGEANIHKQAGGDAYPRQPKANEVQDWPKGILAGDVFDGSGVDIRREQTTLAGRGVSPEYIEENSDEHIGRVEQYYGGPLVRSSQVHGQHSGRERDRRHTQEQQKVENEQQIVTALDMGKQAVVIHPHDADEGKTHGKGNVRGPLFKQLSRQLTAAWARNLDLQNQQGDGNGEDPV